MYISCISHHCILSSYNPSYLLNKENSIKLIILNTSKTNRTSSIYGFMRQVRRRNNPNKKTLIYIPYVSLHRNPSVYDPNCKTSRELLITYYYYPIYRGMCPNVPIHIHPYMSKLRLLLKTNDETNGLCLLWVSYILRTTTQDVPLLEYGTWRKAY